jgi:pimeloyl-ACP methyl ester carboxylesterase
MDYFIEGADEWAGKPKLLLVHGFGGCGVVFYRLIGHLRKSCRVTTIDLLGLAGSGRPSFSLKTA